MFNFLNRFFSIGIAIGDAIKNAVGCCIASLPYIARELRDMILFYLSVLPHVLLFVATLGFSKAIKDMLQERRERKVLVAGMAERQRIEKASTERWMALREQVNVYDPIAMKAYLKV